MSEEPTTPDPEEAIRRSLGALSRRDYDAALAPFSEHAVFDLSAAGAEVIEGHEAIREFFETWRSPYDKFELVLEEFRDRGRGVTLSIVAQRGQLPGSSSFLFVRGAHVGVWRDGLLDRNTVYPETDLDEGRAAAERLAQERG